MKTTDVYVEQVLVGLLVVLTACLFTGKFPEFSGQAKDIGLTFQILGAAYLLGILYDRFADTLLQNLEQHSRLAAAIDRIEAKVAAETKGGESKGEDPFPEDKLRLAILEKGQGLSRYADYLRSRIRLSRAMAAILPALSVAYAAFLIRPKQLYGWQTVGAIYLLMFLLNLLHWPEKLPKTNSDSFAKYRAGKPQRRKRLVWYLRAAAKDPSVLGAVLLFVFLQWMVSGLPDTYIRILPLTGLAATCFAGWVWYRINWTHLTLLRDYADNEEKPHYPRKGMTAAVGGRS